MYINVIISIDKIRIQKDLICVNISAQNPQFTILPLGVA